MPSDSSADAPEPASASERRQEMLACIRAREFVRIQDLAALFRVSTVTVRSDVDKLARDGAVRRVRGGVMQTLRQTPEVTFEERRDHYVREKELIARAAVDMLSPGDSVILDGGTTTMAIARAIADRTDLENLTVFATALNVALALERAIPRIQVVVTGGTLRPQQHSMVEPMGTLILERVRASVAFIGCNSISPELGIMALSLPDAALKQAMIAATERAVIVSDTSKCHQSALASVCGFEDVDLILTAGALEESLARGLREAGANLVFAGR